MAKNKKPKKKGEWSKKICGIIAFAFGVFAIWCGLEYYNLTKFAIEVGGTPPDATLAVTAMSVVIGALLSYLLYQMGLKNSRNKYGVDEQGNPYKSKIEVIDEMESDE